MYFTTAANMRALLITLFATLTVTLIITGTPTLAVCCKDDESGQCENLIVSVCPGGSHPETCCHHLAREMTLEEAAAAKRGGTTAFEGGKQEQA